MFEGIITAQMKSMFNDAISALLENTACTVPCTLIFGDTKFTECSNCYFDSIGNKSSGTYKAGGPRPFTIGKCPVCLGVGRIPEQSVSEQLSLIVIWDYRQWINWRGVEAKTLAAQGYVQTMCDVQYLSKLKQVKEIIINSDIGQYSKHLFQRDGEPTPIGFGNDKFIVTMWKVLT